MSTARKIEAGNLAKLQTVSKKKDTRRATMTEAVSTEVLALVSKDGKTRGKNPRDIVYSQLNRVPKDLKEFMELIKPKESDVVEYLYTGYNESSYSAASDEIGEFIPDNWSPEIQGQFRLAVRNFSKVAGMSIEQAVALIKPGVEKKVAADVEAAKVAANTTPTA